MITGRFRHAAAALAFAAVALVLAGAAGFARVAVAAGPPFPDPIPNQAVYDYAGVFKPETIASLEQTIDDIEQRTGAEVAVVTQVKPYATTQSTEEDARRLITQWGVGRKGFDDGMAILFNLDESLRHGEVQLYAAPGFQATYLSNSERQRIFEDDMLPRLRDGDLDGAVLAALAKIDEAATGGHAARLQLARQIDAVVGLIGAPLAFLLIAGWTLLSWYRYGRDPVYLDDPSILMPAPPPGLTAASGAAVMDGRVGRRALTTAMLDLASRGRLAFREEHGPLGIGRKVGIQVDPPVTDPVTQARVGLNQRRPLSAAEDYAYRRLDSLAPNDSQYIEPDELLKFGSNVEGFNEKLEANLVANGWFAQAPSKTVNGWIARGIVVFIVGAVAFIAGINLPSQGLVLLGVAIGLAAVAMVVLAQSMPAVTLPGSMIRAMLAAYRRTLEKTMAQARSMNQVVAEAGLPWLETPDQAVVWGTALGLQAEIEKVLERSVDDVREGRLDPSTTYAPSWYGSSSGGGWSGGGGGLFSSSAVPNFGGMMSALGTIGNSPSSSGSGGGFGGGGGGGGGGGAGGSF